MNETQTHVFKASKSATIQELLDTASHFTGEHHQFIELSETSEDIVEGKGLITVKARGLQVICLAKNDKL